MHRRKTVHNISLYLIKYDITDMLTFKGCDMYFLWQNSRLWNGVADRRVSAGHSVPGDSLRDVADAIPYTFRMAENTHNYS